MSKENLYIILVSIHGLVRSKEIELGRDSDTGGQIKYVIELARDLSKDKRVWQVDILTRLVDDPKVGRGYKNPIEKLNEKSNIVRLSCGPRRYLRKEVLWPYLDSFTDGAIYYIKNLRRVPDVLHSHYADAGYVTSRLAGLLDVVHIHTGHSLGRIKQKQLREQGLKEEQIEKYYNIRRRIEAEEMTLDNASLIIASTTQEVEEQYSLYDNYDVSRLKVIPPGVDLSLFEKRWNQNDVLGLEEEIDKFLTDKKKPCILALSRPDPKKNIDGLLHVYGKSKELQELANLVLILGNREDISALDRTPKRVLEKILYLIDLYNLYGKVSYPKEHHSKDVPKIYKLVSKRGGIFVNPALSEPFGLTIIESAASGLPVVATNDGGPSEILKRCKNGLLVDAKDADKLERILIVALKDKKRWEEWKVSGLDGVKIHYTWEQHVKNYLSTVEGILKKRKVQGSKRVTKELINSEKVLICDIDNTLLGDAQGLLELKKKIYEYKDRVSFGVATGRTLKSALEVLEEWEMPLPEVLITSVGSEIHYGPKIIQDMGFKKHIAKRWNAQKIVDVMLDVPGLIMQDAPAQRTHKISYYIDPKESLPIRSIRSRLRRQNIQAKVIFSHNQYLDILPIRASKGLAVRYFAMKWNIPFENILVAGDSGNDAEMLRGNTLAVVVGNYSSELEKLRGEPHIYFAQGKYSWGILEGIENFGFFKML